MRRTRQGHTNMHPSFRLSLSHSLYLSLSLARSLMCMCGSVAFRRKCAFTRVGLSVGFGVCSLPAPLAPSSVLLPPRTPRSFHVHIGTPSPLQGAGLHLPCTSAPPCHCRGLVSVCPSSRCASPWHFSVAGGSPRDVACMNLSVRGCLWSRGVPFAICSVPVWSPHHPSRAGAGAGIHWMTGGTPQPSPCPATVFLAAGASFNGICNRPPTALATSSSRLSNRIWGRH